MEQTIKVVWTKICTDDVSDNQKDFDIQEYEIPLKNQVLWFLNICRGVPGHLQMSKMEFLATIAKVVQSSPSLMFVEGPGYISEL